MSGNMPTTAIRSPVDRLSSFTARFIERFPISECGSTLSNCQASKCRWSSKQFQVTQCQSQGPRQNGRAEGSLNQRRATPR